MDPMAELFILTGAPGSGKTAMLAGLGPEITTVAEPARVVLAEERAAGRGRLPDTDFVARMLAKSIDNHQRALEASGPVVFDRAVPDCVGYATYFGTDPAEAVAAAAQYRYRPEVLVAEPWADIYTTDEERTMSFELTVRFHEHLLAAYDQAGYRLLPIPQVPLDERIDFVRSYVA
jgi:predicted ATPase